MAALALHHLTVYNPECRIGCRGGNFLNGMVHDMTFIRPHQEFTVARDNDIKTLGIDIIAVDDIRKPVQRHIGT